MRTNFHARQPEHPPGSQQPQQYHRQAKEDELGDHQSLKRHPCYWYVSWLLDVVDDLALKPCYGDLACAYHDEWHYVSYLEPETSFTHRRVFSMHKLLYNDRSIGPRGFN